MSKQYSTERSYEEHGGSNRRRSVAERRENISEKA